MRRRRSSRASSGTSTWKGRISTALSTVLLMAASVGAECPACGSDLPGEELRLRPGCGVAALVDLVPVDEVSEGIFAPAPRRGVDLGREHRDRDREGRDVEGVERAAAG